MFFLLLLPLLVLSSPTPSSCPSDWPQMGSPCDQSGAECEYGTTECCGETYPEIVFECMAGVWQGYYIDTLCILGLAPPCPGDNTTTGAAKLKSEDETTTAISECPSEYPEENSSCMDGLYCPYGMEECCGDMVPDSVYECFEGRWGIMIIDSLCDFGVPCPEDSTTMEA